MEGICGEAYFLPCRLACRGAAVCFWAGGKGKIPDVDADAGEVRGLPGGVLLPDVQSLSPFVGGAADGRGWAYG